ncbi:MAG: hypothetical protein GSR80_001201 [Desulfurococcales archaeon]|nr:hypothetical protein [Desulfurococcales archaeon]
MPAALEARVDEGRVTLVACHAEQFCRTLEERGYLEGGRLYPLEAAFQASRGRVALAGGQTGWEAFLDIIRITGVPLKLAIVYRLLRNRYPEVREWTRPSTLLARPRSGRPLEVLVLEEGEEITIEGLLEWSEAAAKDGHEPVIAVVDRNGQTTFYEARSVGAIV